MAALEALLARLRDSGCDGYLQAAGAVWPARGIEEDAALRLHELRLAVWISGEEQALRALLYAVNEAVKDRIAIVHIDADLKVAEVELRELDPGLSP